MGWLASLFHHHDFRIFGEHLNWNTMTRTYYCRCKKCGAYKTTTVRLT